MSTWPASLPQAPLTTGYSETPRDNVIRSPMGYGPDKTRRRTTSKIVDIGMQLLMTSTQTATLDTFYYDTIAQVGVVDWVHHRLGGSAQYYFTAPPIYVPSSYDAEADEDSWLVTLQMEIRS